MVDLVISPSADGVDRAEAESLANALRGDVESLTGAELRPVSGPSSPGTKGFLIGGFLVSLASAGVFTALFEFLKGWATAVEGRKVSISVKKADGTELALTYTPNGTSPEEMAAFVQRVVDALDRDAAAKPNQRPK